MHKVPSGARRREECAVLIARRFLFPHNVLGLLVRSKSKVNRVPHFAGLVHSVNLTSATSDGLTQVVTASSFTFAGNGDLAVLSGVSLL